MGWELQQYERTRPKTIDLTAVETEPIVVARPHPLARPTAPRIVHPARRRETPSPEPAPAPVDPAPPQLAVELPDPNDPAMLLKIVRLLNAKVGELEGRLAALEIVKRRAAGR